VNTLLNSGQELTRGTLQAIDELFRELGGQILGVIPDQLAEKRAAGLEEPLIQLLLDTRNRLREAKQWALADGIRSRLTELGITVEDRPDGSVWHMSK
jgi:cysteinyl-tRNA synthetase